MGARDRRQEFREVSSLRFFPVACTLVLQNQKIPLEIVNFHYRGACLKITPGDFRFQEKSAFFHFRIGQRELSEKILFRVVWETAHENGLFGVEFTTESSYVLARPERFNSHPINVPVVASQDPLDPNRIIYLKMLNASSSGMLLSTSLSNKHLFPGMELRTATLNIPQIGKTELDLFIENARPGDNKDILLGVSIKGSSHNYSTLMAKYLSNLGQTNDHEERIEKLAAANFIQRELKAHLTIKEIKNERDYHKVLKLRYSGYSNAGKVASTTTWKNMGDGLDKEGIVLGAFLGGQLVASCEFRLHRRHKARLSENFEILQIPGVRSDNLAEINKLVVHPQAQNSDIVLGIFQKIHALAMMNGQPDGLIAAEPKLIPLYKRLGFKETPFRYPHPARKDIDLTLMIIYGETYATAKGMNPYAWTYAFQETQKFFDEIGLHKTAHFSPIQNLQKFGTRAILSLQKKKKKRKQKKKDTGDDKVHVQSTSDPKWTKQHLNATILYPYILVAEEMIGVERIAKILLDFGFDRNYFRSVSNWVSIEFFDEFVHQFSEFGDPYLLNKKAGHRSVTQEVLGSNYFIVKHFFSPRIAFKAFEKFLPKFNKTRHYQVVDSGRNFCRIRITNPDRSLLPKHPSAKENWNAIAEAYVSVLTGRPAIITNLKSAFDGDEYCEFTVQWSNPLFTWRMVFVGVVVVGLFELLTKFLFSHFPAEEVVAIGKNTLVFLSMSFLSFLSWRYRHKYREMMESLSEYEKHADEKYKELQNSKSILEKSYQEGRTLEAINRDIQTSDDLSEILQKALNSLAVNFNFSRSLIMIKDEEQKHLRTAAIWGADSSTFDLWQFKVDISAKRDNPMVLSSVFHSGQSILVNNIDEHKFHLNETSRLLIDQLQTKSFAIVPIPSALDNWGVLIADKGRHKELITRRDLQVLQRLARSIGMALDKKAKIESEKNIRKIFQRFVPAAVVESTLGSSAGPKLGGQAKEVVCLFFDIRNFTQISQQVPPEILCELLNEVLNIVQKHVTQSHGIIDKFLGDGALATWGAVPGSKIESLEVLRTAQNILRDLRDYNLTLAPKGLNPVEVGMGIHKGWVVAGNIGTQERMEFTVIGRAVNLASRLEQLTKIFKCQIVISETLLPLDQLPSDWSIHSGVQVRGLDDFMKIATYTHLHPAPQSSDQNRETA